MDALPVFISSPFSSETVRIKFFLDMLVDRRHPVMLVGGAGCGKTVLVGEKLSQLDENYMVTNVPFNYYYTSEMLQVTRSLAIIFLLIYCFNHTGGGDCGKS